MSCPELLAQNDGVQSYMSTAPAYSGILSCFKLGRSVHPLEPVAPEHSEFLDISSRRRIRIIHIKPEDTGDKKLHKKPNKENTSRRSFRLSTEEYWFTRWNRPMRNTVCNCSFRRSQRFSKYYDRLSVTSNRQTITSISSIDNRNSTVIIGAGDSFKLENYADKLLCDILVAAFKEYSLINGQHSNNLDVANGIVNLAYKSTEDEVDKSVFVKDINYLVKNVTSDSKDQSIKVQNNLIESNNCVNDVTLRAKSKKVEKKKCDHSSHEKKKVSCC